MRLALEGLGGSQFYPKHRGWEGGSAAIAAWLMGTGGQILALGISGGGGGSKGGTL